MSDVLITHLFEAEVVRPGSGCLGNPVLYLLLCQYVNRQHPHLSLVVNSVIRLQVNKTFLDSLTYSH